MFFRSGWSSRVIALFLVTGAVLCLAVPAPPAAVAEGLAEDDGVPMRLVTISGTMWIKDDELTFDETETFPVEKQFILSPAFPQYTFEFEACEGGEVVGELSLMFHLQPDNETVAGAGVARLYEGADCGTDDLEDSAAIAAFNVGPGSGIELAVALKNEGFGGGDEVKINLTITNEALPPATGGETSFMRAVTVSGSMWIKDDEITWDETGTYPIYRDVILSPQNREATFEIEHCEGGEVVGQLTLTVQLAPDNVTVVAGGRARLLEGMSCNTGDLEDEVDIAAVAVPPQESRTLTQNLANRGFGGGDEIEIELVVANGEHTCASSIEDSDCDGLSDALETHLVNRFKPLLIFDEDEPVSIPDEVAAVYQVAPVVRESGTQGAMITIVMLYPRDEGPQRLDIDGVENILSCEVVVDTAVFATTGLFIPGASYILAQTVEMSGLAAWYAAHAGDSEALRIFVAADDPAAGVDADWRIDAILMKRHFDAWEIYERADLVDFQFASGGSDDPVEAVELRSGGPDADHPHPVIYVSSSKHAMYISKGQCEGYTEKIKLGALPTPCDIVFEKCDSKDRADWLYVPTPEEHNVGERHLQNFDAVAGSNSAILTGLYPYSAVWTDERFCGGAAQTDMAILPGQHACAGAISGKWWPPAQTVVDGVAFSLGLAGPLASDTGGETGYVIVDVSPADPPPAAGKGVLYVLNPGGARYGVYVPGSDAEINLGFGDARFELDSGAYEVWSQSAVVGEAEVEAGQQTTLQLDTGLLEVRNPGGVRYGIYPAGSTDWEVQFGFGDATFGLVTGAYDIWQQRELAATVSIYRDQVKTVELDTGLLEVHNPGGVRYGIYPAGSTDWEVQFGFGDGTFGLRSGVYDIWQQGELADTVTIQRGQTAVVELGTGLLEVHNPGGVRYGIYPAGSTDWEVQFGFGDATFGLRSGVYDIWQQRALVDTVTIQRGQTTVVELDTGLLEVRNPGGVRYGIYPAGSTDWEVQFGFGDATFGLRSGVYDIWQQGELADTVTIQRGQTTVVELDTGLLEVHNPGGVRYGIYPAGSTDWEVQFGFGDATFGLRSGDYDIWQEGEQVATVTVRRGETTVVELDRVAHD